MYGDHLSTDYPAQRLVDLHIFDTIHMFERNKWKRKRFCLGWYCTLFI
jgi:hypothetical protein